MELVQGRGWADSRGDMGLRAVAAREPRASEPAAGLGGWLVGRMAARRERDLARQGGEERPALGPVAVMRSRAAEDAGEVPETRQPGGVAGWVMGMLDRREETRAKRQMRVIETLALGGRRQLMLVSCGDERFLVGSGGDNVQTIVRVLTEDSSL